MQRKEKRTRRGWPLAAAVVSKTKSGLRRPDLLDLLRCACLFKVSIPDVQRDKECRARTLVFGSIEETFSDRLRKRRGAGRVR
jgi:hypothetical protein